MHRSHAILSENVPQFVGARASRGSDVGSEMGPVRPDSPYADAGPAEEAGDQEHIAEKHGPAKRRKKTAAQHSRGGGSCVVLGAEGKTFNILPGPWPLLDTMVKTTRATKFTPPVDCASVAANDQEFDALLQTWGGLGPRDGPHSGYLRPFVGRKRLRCMLADVAGSEQFWQRAGVQLLRDLSADLGNHLAVVQGRRSLCRQLSVPEFNDFFGFDPRSGPLLIAASACFWNGAVKQHGLTAIQAEAETNFERVAIAMDQHRQAVTDAMPAGLVCNAPADHPGTEGRKIGRS